MNILENAKELAVLIKKYNDQDLYQRIVDLRDEIFSLREENLALKEQVRAFEEAADISSELTRKENVYYRHHPDGRTSGPYCLGCWDGDRKLVNVMEFAYTMKCGRCNQP